MKEFSDFRSPDKSVVVFRWGVWIRIEESDGDRRDENEKLETKNCPTKIKSSEVVLGPFVSASSSR